MEVTHKNQQPMVLLALFELVERSGPDLLTNPKLYGKNIALPSPSGTAALTGDLASYRVDAERHE